MMKQQFNEHDSQDTESERLICYARIAQQTERYDDQISFMTEFFRLSQEIKYQQLQLYEHGCKCKINNVRTAWRAVSTLQHKQTNSKSRSAAIIQFYKQKLEKQIREICQQVICLISSPLLSNRQKIDQKSPILLYKIKADYHRYLCQIAKDEELKRFQKQSEQSYLKGLKSIREAEGALKQQMKTDALLLGISLNLSVFYYQILNQKDKAIQVSERAFNECLENVSDIQDGRFTDLVTIMQLVHDNLVQWKGQN